jgi:hypothetical protein
MSLRFRPDLVAVPSPRRAEQVARLGAGETSGALGAITFRNVGPSGSPGGKFSSAGRGDLTLSWEIRPVGGDASGGNNFSSDKIIVCGTSTTDPRCKK